MRPLSAFAGLLIVFGTIDTAAAPAHAATSPSGFMQALVRDVRQTLQKGDVARANLLFADRFDMPRFGQRCLIDHWSEFTQPERERYTRLLEANLRRRIQEKMLFTKADADFALAPTKVVRTGEGTVVENRLRVRDGDFRLVLTLVPNRGGWQIVDYELEGALLSRNYRGHFNYLLRKYGKDGFFSRLEEKLSEGARPPE